MRNVPSEIRDNGNNASATNVLLTKSNALARKKQETRRVRATKETLLTDDPTTEDIDA